MHPRNRLLLVNSTVALVLAGMATITLHELAHAATSLVLGQSLTLFATSTQTTDASDATAIATASAGPVFSLVFGLIVVFASRRWGSGFWRLAWMWLGFTSAQLGFGYCMIAAASTAGDTGRVLELLGAPGWVAWVSLAFGICGMLWLSRLFAPRVLSLAAESPTQMRSFGLFPWLIGTAVLVGIYLTTTTSLSADEALLSVLGVVAIAVFAPMFSFFTRGVTVDRERLELGVPIVGIVCTVAMALEVTLVLSRGIQLG